MSEPIQPAVPVRLRALHVTGLGLLALALTVLFFAPRLWLMVHETPDTTQWARAQTYLAQCAEPLRRDIEPAMLWRLLPPLVAHGLHLPGKFPLVLPWLGAIVLTVYVAVLLHRRCAEPRYVFGGTLLFTATSALLVPIGWLGINDAWVWLGLLAVAFGRSAWAVPLACLLCPWVDERFVIGLPFACLLAREERADSSWIRTLAPLAWVLPYALVRFALSSRDPVAGDAIRHFAAEQFSQNSRELSQAPLGWWMGLRAGWVAVALLLWSLPAGRRVTVALALTATLLVTSLLASDLSRSAAIVTPAILAGCFLLVKKWPERAASCALTLGCANLLIPAAHVTLRFIDPISPRRSSCSACCADPMSPVKFQSCTTVSRHLCWAGRSRPLPE